jgi:hypothetical protein
VESATAPVDNAIERINFGDRGTEAAGESAHGVDLQAPTRWHRTLGQTYRVIAASSTAPGDPWQNVVLAFDMACDANVQNYLTVKLRRGDTTVGTAYLHDSSGGYKQSNYNSQSIPESTFGKTRHRWPRAASVTSRLPIPIAWTEGKASVHLTLNAVESFSYCGGRTTTQLGPGQTNYLETAWTGPPPPRRSILGRLKDLGAQARVSKTGSRSLGGEPFPARGRLGGTELNGKPGRATRGRPKDW